jgi:hypothetical protein
VIANRPPVAFTQSVSTNFETPTTIFLRGSDPDFDTLTFLIDTPPDHGVLSGTPPNVLYTPNSGFSGADSFVFKTNDGKLDSTAANVSITVRSPCSITAIAFGESKTGDLNNTECFAPHRFGSFADLYTFSGTAGQLVRITMNSNFGPTLILQNPSGTFLSSSSFCSGLSGSACIPFDANFGGVFSLPATGTYTIEATSFNAGFTGNYTVSLSLVPMVTLTVNRAGTGGGTLTSSPFGLISCGSDCSENFISGRSVTLFANPDFNSLFDGWSGGGCSGTGSCFLVINSDTTVTANFKPAAFIATTTPSGGETWKIGSTQTIRWTSNAINGNVNIQLSRNGGTTWTTIIGNTPNDGAQTWKVAKPAAVQQARIRVCGVTSPSTCGMTSNNFTISKK